MLDSKRQFQKKTYHIFGLQGAQKTKKQVHLNHTAFLNMNHSRNANLLGHRWSWSRPSETVSTSVCAERWYLPEMFHSHHIHNIRQLWSPKLPPIPQLKTHICRQTFMPCHECGECVLNETVESHPSWSVFDLPPPTHLLLKIKWRRLAMSSPSK